MVILPSFSSQGRILKFWAPLLCMLTRTLRDLERNGLVDRKVYPVVPPMVEYSLTPLGLTLNQVLKSLCDWSTENFQQVEAARDEYDR
jgi:DNA-binding HxlR family transcriptional regulator